MNPLREWRRRYRAWRCKNGWHFEKEHSVLDHDHKPTRLILVQCRHCGLNYTRWDPAPRRRRAF